MKKTDCSVIIRAYNEEKHLRRLLQGIGEQSIKNIQVVLVDSGSTDGTVQIAKEFGVDVVQIQPEEFSFGRSLNLGIEHSKANLIVITSAHVYPIYPDWLATLTAPFKDPEVGLTYGKQRGGETTHFSEHQIFHHWFPDISVIRQAYPFCNNANAAIRKELWQQHAYDESLPGLEDLEWGKWAQENGFSISYVAEAEIIHLHEQSLDGVFNRYKREGMAFKRIFPQETFGFGDVLRLVIQNVIADWKVATKQRKLFRNFLTIMRFRWKQFYGTYHGYLQSGPLTWQLKKAFYYPRIPNPEIHSPDKREVDPIQYQ